MSQWYSAEKGMRPTTFSTRTRQRQRRGPICSKGQYKDPAREMGRCGHRRGCGYTHANGYRLDAYGVQAGAQACPRLQAGCPRLQMCVCLRSQAWMPTVAGVDAYGCRPEHLQRRDDAVARALDEGLVPAQAAGGLLGEWCVEVGRWWGGEAGGGQRGIVQRVYAV